MALQTAKDAENRLAGFLPEHKENDKFSLLYYRESVDVWYIEKGMRRPLRQKGSCGVPWTAKFKCIQKLVQAEIIEPLQGKEKGKYKFKRD